MKNIGISIYPDFYDIDFIQEQLSEAQKLGYKEVFTSLQLGDLGFENTEIGMNEKFQFLFDYCDKHDITVHADINATMLRHMGGTPHDLSPIKDIKIGVLRLDGGFTDEEAAIMTKNPYGIVIEENASMLKFPQKRIDTIVEKGNIEQYYSCHNFFPLNETGLSYNDSLEAARLFKSYGIKVGIFIGSLYSKSDLNAVGQGVVTIEDHRYKPSHIQAMELFAHDEYDYVMFGDSCPTFEEMKIVSQVAQFDDMDVVKKSYEIGNELINNDLYCLQIPVWFDKNLDSHIKKELLKIVFLSRADQPKKLLRATQSRGKCAMPSYLPIERVAYCLTLNNNLANRYSGELQIPLENLPAVSYSNVIGMVKPYGQRLVQLAKYAQIPFVLKEE